MLGSLPDYPRRLPVTTMPVGRPRGPNYRDPNRVRLANGRPRRLAGALASRSARSGQTANSARRHLRYIRVTLMADARAAQRDAPPVRMPTYMFSNPDYRELVCYAAPPPVLRRAEPARVPMPPPPPPPPPPPTPEECRTLIAQWAHQGSHLNKRGAQMLCTA